MGMLTDRDRALLEFEEAHWAHRRLKEQQIRDTFGVSAARYYQRLTRLALDPMALAEFPQLVKRMLNRMDRRERAQAARTSAAA